MNRRSSLPSQGFVTLGLVVLAACLAHHTPTARADDVLSPFDAALMAMDKSIDWSGARLLAVRHERRDKTFESFSREMINDMTGHEQFRGLSPFASALEWIFNAEKYQDVPLIRIKEMGLRMHFSAHMAPEVRQRIRSSGLMTRREFIGDPTVLTRMQELDSRAKLRSAMSRAGAAYVATSQMPDLLRFVPRPDGDRVGPWFSAPELVAASSFVQSPSDLGAGMTPELAERVLVPWASLRASWLKRDAAGVQTYLDQLVALLPTIGPPEAYPSQSQRNAEARYYAMGKFTDGAAAYFIGLLFAIWALITGWRFPRIASIILAVAGLGFHAYGIGLRWYILDRIPVANMFEAVVWSVWVGVAVALVLELVFRTRVFLVAALFAGFFFLLMAGEVIPGGGTLASIPKILNSVMLYVHTTLIIASYALIFIGGVIAVIYLFGYYWHKAPAISTELGLVVALAGAAVWIVGQQVFPYVEGSIENAGGYVRNSVAGWSFTGVAVAAGVASLAMIGSRVAVQFRGAILVLAAAAAALAVGSRGFALNSGLTMLIGGLAWSGGTWLAVRLATRTAPQPAMALAGAFGATLLLQRPVMAGAALGDEGKARDLPQWLHHMDWSHLIILNLVFVMLFVGTILGAWWADFSWGRPWGWDPKEVFALNTWIIYAILIHARFLAKNRGLCTAWLSVAGCLMMAFNWVYVNFFLVGLHSYA